MDTSQIPPNQIVFQKNVVLPPWAIRRNPVYRFLDKKFVDEFFETGAIQLSSFNQFSRNPDEASQDRKEGKSFSYTQGKTTWIAAASSVGSNAWVLCGCMNNLQGVMEEFRKDSYIKIEDTFEFALAIGAKIQGYIGGMEGPCVYQKHRIIQKDISEDLLEKIRQKPNHEDFILATNEVNQGDDFFLKEERFAQQMEYRFIWNTNRPAAGTIKIICPEAVAFCKPMSE